MRHTVTIRQLIAADEPSFVAGARASLALHQPWVGPPLDSAAFDKYLARFDGVTNYGFVVVASNGCDLAGAINLTNLVCGAFCSGYLSYFAFAGFERRGIMKQGLQAVLRHTFESLKLHRVEANIQPENVASIGLVRTCGFRKEGYSPAYLKIRGRWRDHERWAFVRGFDKLG